MEADGRVPAVVYKMLLAGAGLHAIAKRYRIPYSDVRDARCELVVGLYGSGFTEREVGERVGMGESGVCRALKRAGAERRPPGTLSSTGQSLPARLYQELLWGAKPRRVAERHYVSYGDARDAWCELVVRLYENGLPANEVGEWWGMTEQSVRYVLKQARVEMRPCGRRAARSKR